MKSLFNIYTLKFRFVKLFPITSIILRLNNNSKYDVDIVYFQYSTILNIELSSTYIACSVGDNIIIIRLDYFDYFLNNLFKRRNCLI